MPRNNWHLSEENRLTLYKSVEYMEHKRIYHISVSKHIAIHDYGYRMAYTSGHRKLNNKIHIRYSYHIYSKYTIELSGILYGKKNKKHGKCKIIMWNFVSFHLFLPFSCFLGKQYLSLHCFPRRGFFNDKDKRVGNTYLLKGVCMTLCS